jgi:MEMO1 family protein
MIEKKYFLYFLLIFYFVCNGCSSQSTSKTQDKNSQHFDRQPAFAGQFYPGTTEELKQLLSELFAKAEPKKSKNLQAIIVPHAGYIYSGTVAASGFNQIDMENDYDNIFIIGSSHTTYYEGASIYSEGNFITPLGTVQVNTELANKLKYQNPIFKFGSEAHAKEHSIEVQLPFLQFKIKNNFRIIPIIIGTQSEEDCQLIAKALKPYFNESNLFIISSDFSHYPNNNDAKILDAETANSILTNDPKTFLKETTNKSDKMIPGLVTRACGWTSILTLLYLTNQEADLEYKIISYKNSASSDYGDSTRVVGYNAIVACKRKTDSGFILSEKDCNDLLAIARNTIESYISKNVIPDIDTEIFSISLKSNCGAFVTLKENGELRGCIGRFDAEEPLFKVLQQMAISSATQDMRFSPVNKSELKDLKIEISVLTPLRKISSIDEIKLGKHGIYLKKGTHSGTFLPQVATETGWNLQEFLGHCSRDKAGIGWDGWKEAEIYTYEAIVFSE